MTPEQERAGYQASINTIQRVTGTRPVGFNAFWLRGTPNTLGILKELGFIYHIDDISRDEPVTVTRGYMNSKTQQSKRVRSSHPVDPMRGNLGASTMGPTNPEHETVR